MAGAGLKRKAKKRAGRPALGRVKFTTTLAPATVKWLHVFGLGNSSKAIEDFVSDELAEHGDFWKDTAKNHGWWDESMKLPRQKPDNQSERIK